MGSSVHYAHHLISETNQIESIADVMVFFWMVRRRLRVLGGVIESGEVAPVHHPKGDTGFLTIRFTLPRIPRSLGFRLSFRAKMSR